MKYSFIKSKPLITILLFLIATALVGMFVAFPSIKKIQIINAQLLDKREALEILYVQGHEQRKVRDRYIAVEAQSSFLDEMMLDEGEELEYITSIETLADRHNLALTLTIGNPERDATERIATLPFTFELSGSWPDVLRWLEAVERLPYYTNISEVIVSSRQKYQGSQSDLPTVTIQARTYWHILHL